MDFNMYFLLITLHKEGGRLFLLLLLELGLAYKNTVKIF